MKKAVYFFYKSFISSILVLSVFLSGCEKKTENPVKFPLGTFPDTVINLMDLNTEYDDYNLDIYALTGNGPVIFSSNRKSFGGQFDLQQGGIAFAFDQTTGAFDIASGITDDQFLKNLLNKAETTGNDFGPYRFFSSIDGYEYTILSSVNSQGNLDFKYLKNRPQYGANIPDPEGPYPLNLLNSASDDAYFSFDTNHDSAYFTSDRNGNFDIFLHQKPAETEIATWFNQGFTTSVTVDSINSVSDDKCPQVMKKFMVFTSNRTGGLGGFDLYYSVLRNGKWSSPVNCGPGINTAADEYRPVLGYHPEFTNYFMMFSSNRSGGKGGFDLYFAGVDFEGDKN